MKQVTKQFLLFLLTFTAIEFAFRIQSSDLLYLDLYFRSFLYAAFLSFIFLSLNTFSNSKLVTFITSISVSIISAYAFFQIAMNHYYGSFFSTRFISREMPQVQSYAKDFIAFLSPNLIVYPVILVVFLYFYLKSRNNQAVMKSGKVRIIGLLIPLLIFLVYLLSLRIDTRDYLRPSMDLYKNPFYTQASLNQLGLIPFMGSDFIYLINPEASVQTIDTPIEEIPIVIKPQVVKDPFKRTINDSQWHDYRDKETDDNFNSIDNYFLSQGITAKNKMTGILEGNNLIYILVEAFDELAIHPILTPTLSKLKDEGIYMNQFHSPQFNCATAESELMSVSGIYPLVGTCTYSNYYQNTSPQTVYKLFQAKGYATRSFHNWTDQFYPRSKIHPELGSQLYKDESQTLPGRVSGWQSDLEMMKTVVRDLNDMDSSKPFMAYVIGSSTHFPYDKPSYLGDKFASEVRAVHPNAPADIVRYLSKAMEFDRAIQYLLENLETIDKTSLVLFSDHTPFKMASKDIEDYTPKDGQGRFYDSTPMIIYGKNIEQEKIEKVASTIDLLPTIANLYNLQYDPRIMMGTDIFSNENPTVIMQSGSWRDQTGRYDVEKALFTPYDPAITYTQEEINKINQEVITTLSISSQVYLKGYFHQRPFLSP